MDLEPRQHAPVIDPGPIALNRRGFLGLGGAAGLATAALFSPGFARAAAQRPDSPAASGKPRKQAKNVIFMVSDGMSFGTLTLAEIVRRARDAKSTHWPTLWSREGVRRSTMRTASANSLVTDSSAAASAWGSGVHINNDAVNFTPDKQTPVPILIQAKQNGKATGLVTTTRVTHATPAGFIANCPSRNLEDAIARQIAERNVDVVLGGGGKHFPDAMRSSLTGTTIVSKSAEMAAAAKDKPLLGLFSKSHTPYDTDRGPDDPSLAEMTRVALARLEHAPNGFVLQIEGGRVDHAAHANDAGSLVHEQLAFDDAIGVVLAWLENRDDTLLIVTTDHANANPGLTLYGPETYRCVERLGRTKHSFEWLFEQLQTKLGYDDPVDTTKFKNEDRIPSLIEEATGVTLRPDEIAAFTRALRGQQAALFTPMSSPACTLGACLANHLGVAFISPNHTADYVELTSMGPGSELIAPFIDNIELHEVMIKSLDLAPAKAI
ncbi:MAG: alkaline phosphatase [Phycisphaerales bacterium]|nr:alkaline phosphatase [Phycisphaerales bacterium]